VVQQARERILVISPDWVAAVGQAAGAVFTACAVAAALGIAGNESRSRRTENMRRSLAQARLVLAPPPTDPVDAGQSSDGFRHEVFFKVENFSDRPILGVVAEVWDKAGEGHWTTKTSMVLPGRPVSLPLRAVTKSSGLKLGAWSIRWTDADGAGWCINDKTGPFRYVERDVDDREPH
jgi:hypothetical protein